MRWEARIHTRQAQGGINAVAQTEIDDYWTGVANWADMLNNFIAMFLPPGDDSALDMSRVQAALILKRLREPMP